MSDSNSSGVGRRIGGGDARQWSTPAEYMPDHLADGHVERLSELAESMGLYKTKTEAETEPTQVKPRRGRRF